MFNKLRNGINKLNKLTKDDDEINQALSYVIIISVIFSMLGCIIISRVIYCL